MILKSFTLWMILLIQLAAGIHRVDFSQNDYGYINVYLKQLCHSQLNKHIKIQFPYVKFDRQQAPSFDSLKRVSESTSIFVDQKTKQTLFESSNQIYIISSLMNFDEKIISLGELITNGYASLSNDHSPIESDFDITSHTISDSHLDEDLPRYNYELNRFDDSIRTDYQTDFQEICEINIRMRRSYYQKKNYKKPDYYQPYYRKPNTVKPCVPGYSLSPSGRCVNLMSDFYNCGSFNYVCSDSSKICSNGSCISSIAPLTDVPITDWVDRCATTLDDYYAIVNLPLNLTLYNHSSSEVTVTTNGVICLGEDCSTDFSNDPIPTDSFLDPSIFCFWDDLIIRSNTSNSIKYSVDGKRPKRVVTFTFNLGRYASLESNYHFEAVFYEKKPGFVQCNYLSISDGGQLATIGVQYSPSGPSTSYSFNNATAITNGTKILFDTNHNTYSVL